MNDWKWELQSDRALLSQNPVRTQPLEEHLCLRSTLPVARDEITNLTFTCTDFLTFQSLESKSFRDLSKWPDTITPTGNDFVDMGREKGL